MPAEHRQKAEEATQEGRFPGTVRAEESEELALLDGEAEMLEHRTRLVPEADVVQPDERLRHQLPCTAFSMVRRL